MRESIEKAYKNYIEIHNVKPDFLSLNHEDFHKVIIESFNSHDATFLGMHALVLGNAPSGFEFHQKDHLDQVLKEFIKKSGSIQKYLAYKVNPIKIIGRDENSTSKLSMQDMVTPIEVDYKVIQAYQRHLEMKKNGEAR